MNNVFTDMDYQDTIRAAALAFLERHQGEHLGDLGQFMSRTIDHLVESLEVKEPLATRLACLAYSDLQTINSRQRIDRKASSEYTVVITDPVRGCSWSVHAYLIYEHLIAVGHGTRLTPAT
ncbi:hypothetical protein [Pseudomonas violetae]|uniref:Uncharacterized protein n=1 Tax=Pseudomonas violetae TaxID=2915813 RepID=A0ABT0F621_9PSED|nr:hypothetical protein [Pseudomonas violetae]MCK1793107.1 hypothetical protein [Pseudomonas violetae]